MAYISKKDVLRAYKILAEMRPDPSAQGATQNTSAIRHFAALDRFYKTYGRSCNTRNLEDKMRFASFVGDVCRVHEDWYTANFFYPLKKHQGDYNVGSNFYSAGQVSDSLVAQTTTFIYPKRGNAPLMLVKNGELLRDTNLYKNIDSYIKSERFKVAFALWLIRELPVGGADNDLHQAVTDTLRGQYTEEFVGRIFPDTEAVREELAAYEPAFGDSLCDVSEKDIKALFAEEAKRAKGETMDAAEPYAKYLAAIRTKPFLLLAGISGTGKSRMVREFAFMSCPEPLRDERGTTPGNYLMVEVKPNWHDSTELLGYYSHINKRYVFTPFVKFLVKAMMYPETPFFVCLDEMNLAPVEQYFAEFLSVLETRKLTADGRIHTSSLVDAAHFKDLATSKTIKHNDEPMLMLPTNRDIYLKLADITNPEDAAKVPAGDNGNSLLTEGLTLPPNVIVVGTVNMDDTTYKFSRKVIDRAMTIEVNGGKLHEVFRRKARMEYRDEPVPPELFRSRYVSADDVIDRCEAVGQSEAIRNFLTGDEDTKDTPANRLKRINSALEGTPFQVSYRVMNELVIYFAVLLDELTAKGGDAEADYRAVAETAVDEMMLMKILPRVEGDEEAFRLAAGQGEQLAATSERPSKLDLLKQCVSAGSGAAKKLDEMIARLNAQDFTRFWP